MTTKRTIPGGDDDDKKKGQQQGDDAQAAQGPDRSDLGDEIGTRIGEGRDPVEDHVT